MARRAQKKEEEIQHIGKTLFVFIGFITFLLVFASLGSHDSFRSSRMKASVGDYYAFGISEDNQKFIEIYMPYFSYFALKYTNNSQELMGE